MAFVLLLLIGTMKVLAANFVASTDRPPLTPCAPRQLRNEKHIKMASPFFLFWIAIGGTPQQPVPSALASFEDFGGPVVLRLCLSCLDD